MIDTTISTLIFMPPLDNNIIKLTATITRSWPSRRWGAGPGQ